MSVKVEIYQALDDEEKEKMKKAIAEKLNNEGIDVERVNLDYLELKENGSINATVSHK